MIPLRPSLRRYSSYRASKCFALSLRSVNFYFSFMLKFSKTHNKDQFKTFPRVILAKDFIPNLNSLLSTDHCHGLDSTMIIEILTWDRKSCEGSRSSQLDLTEYLAIWRTSISNPANQYESFLSRKSLSMTQQLSLPEEKWITSWVLGSFLLSSI